MLNDKGYQLLLRIVNNNKCFDKRDNIFLLSNRKIADRLKVSNSSIDRLFRRLKSLDLVRQVKPFLSSKDTYRMLSPRYLFISYNKIDRWMIATLYELKDLESVYKWHDLCKELNCYIDPLTGEVLDFNWWYIEQVANRYTSFDRCYRKNSLQVLGSDLKDDNNSQYYSKSDLNMSWILDKDLEWFNDINYHSDFSYPTITRELFRTKNNMSIYSVNLQRDQDDR